VGLALARGPLTRPTIPSPSGPALAAP